MTAFIIDASGVRADTSLADVEKAVAADQLFWVDVVDESESACAAYLEKLGCLGPDAAPALRFGQAGRMRIAEDRLRVVTWIADHKGALVEFHLLGWGRGLASLWSGDPKILDPIRSQFAERFAGFDGRMPHAAGILLQLLLGTLDLTLHRLDAEMDELRLRLDRDAGAMDFSLITRRLQRLQSFTATFSRYSSAVRSATVGVEIVPGVGPRGAAELNNYVDLVEDFEEELLDRRQWLSDITHEFATAVAQRQGDQISRLTVVSLIFLPMTALTGFFGMNFDWLNQRIASEQAFFVFGVALPAIAVIVTVVWLARRGLMRLDLWR